MPRLRLGYRKSRTGCLRCKQRRVKCDENRPCSACQRHGVLCSLMTSPSGQSDVSSVGSGSGRSARQESQELRNEDGQGPTNDPFPYFEKFVMHQPHDYTGSWIADLELLHHFTTSTYRTLPRATEVEETWQIAVPKLAFTHVFLMHQVLAIAGFHLAYLHPHDSTTYALQASQHQNRGISGIRLVLSSVTAENCHALFAASSLLCIGVFASFSIQDKPTVDSIVDFFSLVRGTSQILNTTQDTLRDGPLGSLFIFSAPPSRCERLDDVVAELERFSANLGEIDLPEVKDAVACMITSIRRAKESSTDPGSRIMMTWPIHLPENYVVLLRQRDPGALAVLAFYCVVLQLSESACWYVRGWEGSVLDDIRMSIAPPWEAAVGWCITRVRNYQE